MTTTTLRLLLDACAGALPWALLLLGCRLAAWAAHWPAGWTIPLALGAGGGWLVLRRLADTLRDIREERAVRGEPADPRQSARMRRAWKRGRSLRQNGALRPEPPWYLCLEQAPTRSGGLLDAVDAADRLCADGDDEFSWRRGPHALWLDYPDAWAADGDGESRWRAFLRLVKAHRAPLAGTVVALEADHLLLDDPVSLDEKAALLHRRLDQIRAARGGTIPVYLVVNRLDCLYGMRSLTAELKRDRLAGPLGAMRREREMPDDFARRVVDACGAELTRLPARHEAAVQAPAELERLRGPLAHFCERLFAGGAAMLRGMYLASSAPGGGTIPPLMVGLPTFRELREAPPSGGSWFLGALIREGIPGDAPAALRAVVARRRRASRALSALALGSLALSSLLTWSFLENRSILLSARGRAAPPESADTLEPYLDLALATRQRARERRLPRFGMAEAERLADELRRRYTESYFDLKTVPGVDRVQEAALAAVGSGAAREIGNALLMLAVTREGISRALGGGGEPEPEGAFLRGLAEKLGLAGRGEMRQLDTYFAWAGAREWMPETRDALIEFERYVVNHAAGGDLSWVLEWAESIPGLDGGARSAEGRRIVEGVLRSVGGDDPAWRERREAFLVGYPRGR